MDLLRLSPHVAIRAHQRLHTAIIDALITYEFDWRARLIVRYICLSINGVEKWTANTVDVGYIDGMYCVTDSVRRPKRGENVIEENSLQDYFGSEKIIVSIITMKEKDITYCAELTADTRDIVRDSTMKEVRETDQQMLNYMNCILYNYDELHNTVVDNGDGNLPNAYDVLVSGTNALAFTKKTGVPTTPNSRSRVIKEIKNKVSMNFTSCKKKLFLN